MRIESKDVEILREFILLSILLSVFEKDKKIIQQSSIKIPSPYLDVIEKAMKRVLKSLTVLKQEMKKRGLKITRTVGSDFSLRYEYLCRGYQDIFEMPKEFAKAETEKKMRSYLSLMD